VLPTHGDPAEMPLSIRQRVNIGLVSVFSQAILITFVALVLASFFMLFGFLAVPEATTAAWTQLPEVHVLAHWHIGGRTLVLSEPLLRVSGFLGAFTGMYFTVVLGTDATYRGEFAEDAGPQIRQALAVRLAGASKFPPSPFNPVTTSRKEHTSCPTSSCPTNGWQPPRPSARSTPIRPPRSPAASA